jgi:hypothetical protein
MWAAGAVAQGNRFAGPLTDPARPATLEVALFNGSVVVTAYDGNEIVIATSEDVDEDEDEDWDDDEPADPDRAGMRQIRNTAFGLTAEENNNVVSVTVDWGYRGVDLDISVPRRTSVRARTHNGEEIRIEGVDGEHELVNTNGDIIGVDVRGSVVATSQNGDIDMSFLGLTPGKAMSFNSFNGDIEVAFPPSLAADLNIGAGRGDVYTDFEVELRPQSSVVEGGQGGRKHVRLENSMHAIVGGGGSEIAFKSFNGDVVIRRR